MEVILKANPTVSARVHAQIVKEELEKYPLPSALPERKKMSNEGIERLIWELWDQAEGKGGRILRILRDELLVECEQKRCSELFNKVKARKMEIQ